jgi:hypothetical protein
VIRPAAVLLAFAALLLSSPSNRANAQQPATILGVEITLNRPQSSVGDRLILTLQIRHRPDVAVTATPDPPSYLEFGKPAISTLAMPDGAVQTTVIWTVQPFVLGTLNLRPFPVSWVTQEGQTGRFLVQPPSIEVVPIRAPDDTGLRPLKDPVAVPGGPPAWLRPLLITLAVALSLAVLAGLSMLAWRQLRRIIERWRPAPQADESPVTPVSAESSARESLDAVAGLALTGPAAFERYYGAIALVVRRYLTDRIGFNAHALTTDELERRMTANGVDRWQARLVGGLLERCDAAVYAHRFPDPASADHDLTVAYEIVELSRPGAPRTGVLSREATP